jgi:hypothetical protein
MRRNETYFEWKDRLKLPKKYQNSARYIWERSKLSKFANAFDGLRLYDRETKTYVVKNSVSVSRPRMQSIAGNEFFPGLNEHVRMRVVEHLKAEFQRHFPTSLGLEYPIMIYQELHTVPRYANWDLDNLWIYAKCFQDALVEHLQIVEKYSEIVDGLPKIKSRIKKYGVLPNDNIKYITLPPAPRFIPVTREEDRRFEYTLVEDHDPRIKNHLLYNNYFVPAEETKDIKGFLITPNEAGKPGNLAIDVDNTTFMINIGRKRNIPSAIEKALQRVYYHCIQMNIKDVTISVDLFSSIVTTELSNKGVKVWKLVP